MDIVYECRCVNCNRLFFTLDKISGEIEITILCHRCAVKNYIIISSTTIGKVGNNGSFRVRKNIRD